MARDIGSEIHVAIDDGVGTITIDDPDRMNPLSRENYREIADALTTFEEGDAGCVVVEGAGDVFTSGGDVDMMEADLADPDPIEAEVETIQTHEQRMIERLFDCPLPTVANVDGPATGDGANLAIACDIQLASERTMFSFTHVRFGLTMDTGGAYLLPRIVGENVAKELALTGKTVDADEAAELGLVNHVYPTDEFDVRAAELIEQIAAGPAAAQKSIKYLVGHGLEWSMEETLRNEAYDQAVMGQTADFREAVDVFLDGREPEFE
jgi:2-(1,2-epoxy-1,2-dihydrophenyl)acetyl-CoA isomerase